MATPIAMPKLGITMEEGTIVDWPVGVGETVEKGDIVLVIESEKAEVEIEAAASGVVRHYYAEPGDVLPCGSVLGAITETADEPFDATAFEQEETAKAQEAAETLAARPSSAVRAPSLRVPARSPTSSLRKGRAPATPAARVRARALEIDLSRVGGTGPAGRVTRRDVEEFSKRRKDRVTVAEGVALDVPRHGEGVPVLLLPGLGTDVSAFAPQIPALAEKHLVLGVNPRGVAGSDAPDDDHYDVATAAADAVAVAAGPAHVIGASLGAAVALEMALAHPERVRSLTLITPFVEAGPRLAVVADAWCRLAASLTAEDLARSLLPWFFSPGFLSDDAARERTARGLSTTVARVPPETLRRAVAGLHAWSGTRVADLSNVAVPTLVVAGGGDLLTPGASSIADAIPNSTLVVVDDAGHALTIESSDAVTQALIEHVTAHS